MKQDMNGTFRIAFRAMVVAAMTLLTGSAAMAQVYVHGNVYGGGNLADVGGTVTVNMTAGTVEKDVYGGGALANTNTNNTTDPAANITTVNLKGGTIEGNAYGGGLGRKAKEAVAEQPAQGTEGEEGYVPAVPAQAAVTEVEALVYGNVTLKLNESVDPAAKGCIVKGKLFGCNNVNGTPKGNVEVHVYATQSATTDKIQTKARNKTASPITGAYDVVAVYGGGNEAAYVPQTPYNGTTGSKSQVIIEGCDYTSIETVYGGGNAAAVPESNVQVLGAYEIGYVYGGGNGKDNLSDGTANPGADIGQYNNNGTLVTYGTGIPSTTLTAGYIHEAYGGSNQRGVIKGSINLVTNPLESTDDGYCCDLALEKVVGAGKYADIEGDVILVMGCMPESKTAEIFGGADEANVKGNVELTITSGTFGKVFGGNNLGGAILGHIILNIEETGCHPIKIDELYLGGNQAAYSIYGYYDSGTTNAVGKPVYLPRTSASDEHTPVDNPAADANHTFPYAQPVLNVISCTYIGQVFGGGLGEPATMYANPTVNINMIQGEFANSIPSATDNPNKLGEIGTVYGGGNAADVVGDPTVNIGTAATVDLVSTSTPGNAVKGAYITGNVFGGGMGKDDTFTCEKAMVGKDGDGINNPDGGTTVNIGNGIVMGNVYGGGEIGRVEKNTVVTIGIESGDASSPEIKGSVFGGGKGKETHGYAALVRGNPTVTIQGKAKIGHNVYGGGEIASVARYNVPRTEAEVEAAIAQGYDAHLGMPYALANTTSGNCKVTVKDNAIIGPDEPMKMYHPEITDGSDKPDDAGHVFGAGKGILPENYTYADKDNKPKRMVLRDETIHTDAKKGTDWEYVDPSDNNNKNVWEYFADRDAYIIFIQTLALSSYANVTIGDDTSKPFVKGSVYGGSENGLVQFDTKVYIKSGQIGCGKNATAPYGDDVWADGYVPTDDLECYSWDYGLDTNGDGKEDLFAPYDPNANATGDLDKYPAVNGQAAKSTEGGRRIATDGHTYYGNVFGGGSGSVPYFDTTEGISKYLNSAGTVKGNTNVTISGGHILTNVYGGCEATNVLGKATVKMTGGTIGVPRTEDQIKKHPVTCYLFGAGKGDQRIFFNKDTNVENVEVEVDGGRIYGSVFGGGEDGHVMKDVLLTIKETDKTNHPTKIGTRGTSYVDGNIFGGGRGFGGDALTAGNIGGSVTVNIEGGEMLGSIYGGGRLASVGYGLYLTTETGFGENNDDGYGKMQDDGFSDWTKGENGQYTRTEISGFKRGYITVNIKDGTIGNDEVGSEYGGNVFGGSMGRLTKLDGTPNSLWDLLATAKKTTVNVTGGIIKRSVYGGGEMGTVTTDASVIVSGGTIGTSGKGGAEFGNVYGGGKGYVDPAGSNYVAAGIIKGNTKVTVENGTNTTPTIYHNIYGGGAYGSVGEFVYDATTGMPTGRVANTTGGKTEVYVTGGTIGTNGKENGMVFGSSRGDAGEPGSIHDKLAWVYDTHVAIGDTTANATITTATPLIKGSVYGGGENGHNLHSTYVRVNGGTIGIDDASDPDGGANYAFRGNVYGGGCGTDTYSHDDKTYFNRLAGTAYGNTTVNITGGHIVRNVYGGGAMGSVGTFTRESSTDPHMPGNMLSCAEGTGICTVKVSGGQIGPDKMAMPNTYGNVFGAGRGEVHDLALYPNLERVIYVDSTFVNIMSGAFVKGSVYGGSESGHMLNGTYVKIDGGQIGSGYDTTSNTDVNRPYDDTEWASSSLYATAHWAYQEDGKQYDPYADQYDSKGGATTGTDGHTFYGNVFGGGSGSAPYAAGKWLKSAGVVGGNTKVEITGGHILTSVYGGCEVTDVKKGCIVTMTGGTIGVPRTKGEIEAHPVISNIFGAGKGDKRILFNTWTNVDSTKVTVTGGTVYGSVYGGGEDGHVLHNARTTIDGSDVVIGSVGTSGDDGNVYGGGRGSETALTAGVVGGNTYLTIEKGTMKGSVYGGGRLASVGTFFADATDSSYGNMQEDVANGTMHGHITVNINGGTIGAVDGSGNLQASDYSIGDVFGSCKGTMLRYTASETDMATHRYADLGLAKDVKLNMNGGTVNGTIYGGGESGDVQGSVIVNMTGGAVKKDVYGGGALADTQISNWNATTGTWAENKTSASSTTTVNLLGGTITGDAYGGGLGRLEATGVKAIEAMVYGDVSLNLGKANDDTTPATAFNISKYDGTDIVKSGRLFGCNNLNGTPKGNVTVTVNKTVAGNVTRTAITRDPQTHKVTTVGTPHTYEVAAVYGGGNLANYTPDGGAVKVIINGCDVSIEEVYGGGNAAEVPTTDVLVLGAHQIEQVFGGGNGADNYTLDGGSTWNVNPGANVNGDANTLLKGGLIHEAYGGSNEKGTITGNITIDTGSGGLANCPVQVDKLVGAGKNADVNGNMYIILGCKDATLIPIVYGGADNANVNGNVELTITSGHFGKVFGGNNLGGAIRGHVVLNIEETSDCEPIRIDELYLGGNQASYSKYGYYVQTTTSEGNDATGVGAPTETAVLNDGRLIFMPRQSADDRHKPVNTYSFNEATQKWSWTLYPESGDGAFEPYTEPELNIVSCTEIKEVFGGGYGEGGDMYANPTVNINMIPGRHAEAELGGAHELGVIGDVYGGGNAADVVGNVTVNIGTEQTVRLHQDVNKETGVYTMSDPINVEGANIIGNVYGGGKLANVGKYHTETEGTVTTDVIDAPGNTYVNIGVKKGTDGTYSTMTFGEGVHGITIAGKTVEGQVVGGNVFGGGKGEAAESGEGAFRCGKAMVTGGTNVLIGSGTVSGTVYGGGEVGRVENGTVVTIGLGSGSEGGLRTPVIGGSVFGAGKGVSTHGYAALVRGKSIVTVQGNANVGYSIYGGGEIASIGRYNVADAAYHAAHPEVEIGMPYALADPDNLESGKCIVTVKGWAEIGPDDMKMTADGGPDDTGYVFGAGKGVLPYKNTDYSALAGDPWRMTPGNSPEKYTETDFGAGYEGAYLNYIKTLALATETDVTITEHAFVKGSVYGGSENGHVQHDTHVTIDGDCQIGNGFNPETQKGVNRRYTEAEWASESLYECASWPYGKKIGTDAEGKDIMEYLPYDVYKDSDNDGTPDYASDGHTFYGNVFGGGSGLFPYRRNPDWTPKAAGSYEDANGYSDGLWLRSAGAVYGNTVVDIKGGHILTSVYGGNECTDVNGTTTVNMSGGTLGVPRTVEQMKAHPVTCYLFGAGKGDQRINFNTWTNVEKAIVNITGGRIFGSVFGGGEDGHVLGDVEMSISGDTKIGTTGTSYVDGNIFGGGRGFSGDAQTAGTVGGNITLNISGGEMLGSVYGGGRLASVGTLFTAPEDPNYGNFVEDGGGKTYGHVNINISGGIIGNNVGNAESGNVFGGSMGRLNLLNGDINPIWPKMAQVKFTEINISGGTIKRNVYGGGELGTVRDNAIVTITGGTVNQDVYGGGYGSEDDDTKTLITVKEPEGSGYKDVSYKFTPMIFAGCVGKNTYVNISGGQVKKSVYGGGEMASVGIIDCRVDDSGEYINFHKHTDEINGFALSWPYHFEYVPGFDGATHINITGGRLGITGKDYMGPDVVDGHTLTDAEKKDLREDNGDVYGGSKGIAGDYKDYVYCANVGSTEVNIAYSSTSDPKTYKKDGSDCITGSVYGGAENGHVMGDTRLTISGGLIGHAIYGGGKGKGTFTTQLEKIKQVTTVTDNAPETPATAPTQTADKYDATIYSITAGKVFGNTNVKMTGGYVVRNVYGGGNMGSVGKGNYSGGPDDYSTSGYGETITDNLWDNTSNFSQAFLSSGKSTVTITGGTVGYIDYAKPDDYVKDGLPYGNVFGGCRGESAPNIGETPRYLYCPTFFSGYVNETEVTIGAAGSSSGPRIFGSVYGGGQDGHVRRDASVTINSGEIGSTYTGNDLNAVEWLYSGNVYGAGSGIGQYEYDFNYDGDFEDVVKYTNPQTNRESTVKERDFSTSAGSVTRSTKVEVKGGTIHRNVYGGGSLSSIGAPKIPPTRPDDPDRKGATDSRGMGYESLNEVIISGGTIGDATSVAAGYGGDVNGGSRGDLDLGDSFATSIYTDVTVTGSANILGNVFGGGEAGLVKHDTEVKMQGGMVANDVYGGGDMADVNGNTKVLLTGGIITHDAYGGARGKAAEGNNPGIAANVGGDVLVDLNGGNDPAKKGAVVKGNIFGANNVNGTPLGHVLVYVHGTQNENTANINTKVDGTYDVKGVYGGGNASDYVPAASDTQQSTEVIIEGCDMTSIDEVYGGGYGAATPATNVLVKGTKIINNVYGGGYGASTATFTNPGANVGYLSGKDAYTLGTGKAIVQLMAGTINNVYGGSNTLGDIRGGSSVTNVANDGSAGCCEKLSVGEIYGGGKQADMFGGAEIILGCMPNDWIGAIYAGAENANIGGDVGLTLTSGKFERVFGGNKSGGIIDGYIEVNIEENPDCETPIIIGGLYGGGNEAPYTVPRSYVDAWKAQHGPDADYPSPRVNVRAFTSIGNIYGGGFGANATVTGNPLVNINEVEGGREYAGEAKELEDGTTVTLYARSKDAKMGVIGNVFGGGNAAKVIGNPRVEIGTAAKQKMLSLQTKDADGTVHEVEKDVLGADIRGNVYGGGNNADVTGNPNVVIGQKKE